MTVRQLYEAALIECNKVKAPALLLEDYLYLLNKSVQQYVNQVYNRCEYNQQSSDDLSWLHTTKNIELTEQCSKLPDDYLHLLNCIGEFTQSGTSNKYCSISTPDVNIKVPCQRMTADLQAGILNNYYMKPSGKKPYYYILTKNNEQIIEIHSGDSKCHNILLTYIKTPSILFMSEDDIISMEDTTSEVEFPEYVCYEVINIFTRLLLENASDPRLQTNLPINQSIAVPGNN